VKENRRRKEVRVITNSGAEGLRKIVKGGI